MRSLLIVLFALAPLAAVAQVSILPSALPAGHAGSSYAAKLSEDPSSGSFAELELVDFRVSGSSLTYGFRISSGSLPLGLILSPTGALRGIPLEEGTFRFTVEAVPLQIGASPVSREYSLSVAPPFSITQTAEVGAPFELGLSCPALDVAYSFLTQGLLPAGLQLDPQTGAIAGIPTQEAAASVFSWFCLADGIALQVDLLFEVAAADSSPQFRLTPEEIVLTGVSDGPPAVALMRVESASFAGGFEVSGQPSWLRVTPQAAIAPAVLLVTANPAGLTPGTYTATLAGRSTSGDGATDETRVVFQVGQAVPSRLTVTPDGLQDAFLVSSLPRVRLLQVANEGSGLAGFEIRPTTENGGSWLNVFPRTGLASSAVPVPVAVTVDPTGLGAGSYKGALEVSGGGEVRQVVPVTVTVSDGPGLLQLSYTGLTFRVEQGARTPLPQPIFVSERSGGVIDWRAEAATASGGPWLGIAPSAGRTGLLSGLVAGVDAADLPAGSYWGQIAIASDDAANSPQTATIALEVEPPGTRLKPELGQFGTVFLASPLLSNRLEQEVAVGNPLARPATVQVAASVPAGLSFLSGFVESPVVPPGGTTPIQVRVDASGLSAGVYYGFLDVGFAEGGPVSRLEVLLAVAPGLPGGPVFLAEEGGPKEQVFCTPTELFAVAVQPGHNFLAEQGRPVPVEAFLLDNCGGLPGDAAVQARFSNGDPPVRLERNARGGYSGVWTPQRTGSQTSPLKEGLARAGQQQIGGEDEAQITIQANQINTGGVSTEIGGSLAAHAGTPVISPGGAVSAASFAARDPLPPGAYVSIFGGNLAPGVAQAQSLPLPTELDGVSVTAGGRPVALTFVSPGQINGVLPFELTVDAAQQIVVRNGDAISTPETVSVSQAQPAVFTRSFSGAGPGVVSGVRPDGTQFDVGPGSPLREGDAAVIYCAGLGLVDQAVDAAQAAPADPLARTLNGVSVSIGGVQADVFFAGLAPGFAGLYQVNAIVSAGTPSGPEVPLTVKVNEIANSAVTVAVE